jgi:hypothetical protein
MLAAAVLFAQMDAGALMPAGGGVFAVTLVDVDVAVQPAESVTVTL